MLNLQEFLIAIGCAIAIIPIVEIQKLIEWSIRKHKQKKIDEFNKNETVEVEEQM